MYNKRVFNKDNMAKINGLLSFLFAKNTVYAVSYAPDETVPNEYKAVVTWYE